MGLQLKGSGHTHKILDTVSCSGGVRWGHLHVEWGGGPRSASKSPRFFSPGHASGILERVGFSLGVCGGKG